jgi:death on curing protein
VNEPIWVLRSVVDAMHDAQLTEHGGASGVRDEGLLDSALARPRNLHAYGETDLCALGAAYAFGIARNHPFVDGNKRTAFLAAYVFLRVNGLELTADEVGVTISMMALAAGETTEAAFAGWLRSNTRAAPAATP